MSYGAYHVFEQCALLVAGFAMIAFAASLLPRHANAFWPFSTNADAAAADTTLPSSTTPALVAIVNSDPNASAPIDLAISDDALVANTGPAGASAVTWMSASSDRISVYTVRAGDTLSEIADMYGVSINTILWANGLKSARDVHPGDTLIILPVSGIEHTVAQGDTLKSLAKKFGGDPDEIASFNNLDSSSPLAVGSTIIIPGGELAAPTPTASTVRGVRGRTIREPYLGGSGAPLPGFFESPIPGAIITQGIHGWNAVDFGAARGTPIHAAADGVVIIARNGGWNGGYGNYVVITHTNGVQTLYAHMTHALATPGQSVVAGQVIGYVGSTGLSTGAHLHFEVRGAANPFRNCAVGSICAPQ